MTGKQPKIVGMSCVFNEEWIIGEWADALSELVDEIVVVDDGSTDRTVEILRKFPKVTRVHEQRPMRQIGYASREVTNRRLAHQLAREQGADWIVFVDADEIFEHKMKDRIRELVLDEEVGEYRFRKLWLWRCEHYYRADRADKFQSINPFRLFRDAPSVEWVRENDLRFDNRPRRLSLGPVELSVPARAAKLGRIATGRESFGRRYQGPAVVIGMPRESRFVDDLVLLHYSMVNIPREIKKRLKYVHGYMSIHKRRDLDDFVDTVYSIIDETGIELAPVDPSWFRPERRDEISRRLDRRAVPSAWLSDSPAAYARVLDAVRNTGDG